MAKSALMREINGTGGAAKDGVALSAAHRPEFMPVAFPVSAPRCTPHTALNVWERTRCASFTSIHTTTERAVTSWRHARQNGKAITATCAEIWGNDGRAGGY